MGWWIFGKKNKVTEVHVFAPVDGKLVGLNKVKDDVFKEESPGKGGMMGKGFAFEPKNGEFVSPVEGELVAVFLPTKHAYGIKHKTGVEILLHIGLDTVTLNGEGFTSDVKVNQELKVGDKLVDVDLKSVKAKVPSMVTPLIFTNQQGLEIEMVKKPNDEVKKGDLVAILK